MNGHPTHLDPLRPSAPECLALVRPTICSITNPNSPNIRGYPGNAGTNAGAESVLIEGQGFGGRAEQIRVWFEPIALGATRIDAQVRTAADTFIWVRTPPTLRFGAVGAYNVKVAVANQVAQGNVQFDFLATFVVSQDVSDGFLPGAVNAALTGKITFLSKSGHGRNRLYFWARKDDGCWERTNIVGYTSQYIFGRELTLQLTARGPVVVAVTNQPKAPAPDASGSNGTINVGSGQGEEPGVP